MPLIIELQSIAPNQAQALANGQILSAFDPVALRKGMPRREVVDAKGRRRMRKVPREEVVAFGRRLWRALGDEKLAEYVDELPFAPNIESGIVFRTTDVALAGLPWEMLYHPEEELFLIEDYLLWREVLTKRVPKPPAKDAPWRLVVQGCDPLLTEEKSQDGAVSGTYALPRLRVVQELEQLRRSLLAHQPPVPLRWQQIAPTRKALNQLASKEPLWYHFTGHGDVSDGVPVLCFDDGTGRMDAQNVRKLARRLRGRVYLAMLNACHTADNAQPSANLALELVRGGVPVVLGTQDSVLDDAAALFAYTFYQHLAVGELPALALYRARQTLSDEYENRPYEWTLPALYLAEGYQWPQQEGVSTQALQPLLAPQTHTLALQAPDELFGREIELVELASLFVSHRKRVVTIRGAGGMGKTALAHALAQRLRFHFTDGIYAVTLLVGADVALQAGRVRRQLADILGLGKHPAFDDPKAVEAQEVALVQAVQTRPRVLLIFDNYETVLAVLRATESETALTPPAAGASPNISSRRHRRWSKMDRTPKGEQSRGGAKSEVFTAYQEADAIQRLVKRLADAKTHLLFTSRQTPVGLAGESLYPDAQGGAELSGLDKQNSRLLFRAHAGSRRHSVPFAYQVCLKVDYSPLFIELAANRWRTTHQHEAEFLATFDDAMLHAQLEGVPSNRRSAIVNVRLSIDALPSILRQRFLTLSMIANPQIYPIHGAVIWGLEDEESWFSTEAHEQLELLRERSLLRGVGYDKARNRAYAYTLQPVIAQVMRTLMPDDELTTPRTRYAQWAAHLVNRAYGEGGIDFSAEMAEYTQTMLDDLPVALSYLPAEERGWPMRGAARVFRLFGQLEWSQKILNLAEEIAKERQDNALLSSIYYERAELLTNSGDLDGAMAQYQQSLEADEALGDVRGEATTLHAMAGVLVTRGDLDGAMAQYQQSLEAYEALGDVRGKAATLHAMAGVLVTRGDLDGAMAQYQQSLDMKEALGDVRGKATTLHAMAGVLETRGDLDGAMAQYQQSLEAYEALGDVRGKAATLHQMAGVLVTRGDLDGAMAQYQQSLDIKEALGDVRGKAATLVMLAQLQFRLGQRKIAIQNTRESLRLLVKLGARREIAQVQGILAQMEGTIFS